MSKLVETTLQNLRALAARLRVPRRRVAAQYLIVLLCALLLTRISMECVDRVFFDPVNWGTMRVGDLGSAPFGRVLTNKARSLTNEAFTPSDRTQFRVSRGDTATVLVARSLARWYERDSRIVVVELPAGDAAALDAQAVQRLYESGAANVTTLVSSKYDLLTGVRTFAVPDSSVLKVADRLGSNIRWLQLAIEANQSAARVIIMLAGYVQWFTYLAFFVALLLVLVEQEGARRNALLVRDRQLLPIMMRMEKRSQLQQQANRLRGLRANSHFAEDLAPHVVLDVAEPAYGFLLRSGDEPSAADLNSILEASAGNALERLSSRFQLIRYFLNAIPSLGFIGTVLGISLALGYIGALTSGGSQAERLIANFGLSSNLYVAFDTTLVALVLSIMLSLVVDTAETRSVDVVLRAKTTVATNVINLRHIEDDMSIAPTKTATPGTAT